MKRTSIILAVLLVAVVGFLGLWKGLDAGPETSDAITRGSGSERSAPETVPSAPTALVADARERPADSKDTPVDVKREVVTAPAPTPEEISLHGTMKDSADARRTIPGATVKFVRGTTKVVVKTDEDGQFEIANFIPGEWSVSIEAPAYRAWSRKWIFLKEPRAQEFSVGLERLNVVWVALRTPDGGSFFDALAKDPVLPTRIGIMLIPTREALGEKLVPGHDGLRRHAFGEVQSDGGPGSGVRTIADGYFEFQRPLPMFLSACSGDLVLDAQYVLAGQETVTFTIALDVLRRQLQKVRVRVLDADTSAPLNGALVSLLAPGITTSGGRTIDGSGYVQFENQAPGARSLSIHAPDHEWINEVVQVLPTGETDLGTYNVGRSASIEGQCTYENAAPANVALGIFALDGDNRLRMTRGMQRLRDTPGSFLIEQLGRHKYLVTVRDNHWTAKPIVVDTSSGSVRDVKIHCVPAATVVLHIDPELADGVDIVDTDQLPVVKEMVRANGNVELNLFPGVYAATAVKAGQAVSTTRFQTGGTGQVIELGHP